MPHYSLCVYAEANQHKRALLFWYAWKIHTPSQFSLHFVNMQTSSSCIKYVSHSHECGLIMPSGHPRDNNWERVYETYVVVFHRICHIVLPMRRPQRNKCVPFYPQHITGTLTQKHVCFASAWGNFYSRDCCSNKNVSQTLSTTVTRHFLQYFFLCINNPMGHACYIFTEIFLKRFSNLISSIIFIEIQSKIHSLKWQNHDNFQ